MISVQIGFDQNNAEISMNTYWVLEGRVAPRFSCNSMMISIPQKKNRYFRKIRFSRKSLRNPKFDLAQADAILFLKSIFISKMDNIFKIQRKKVGSGVYLNCEAHVPRR